MSRSSHASKFAAPKRLPDGRLPLIGCNIDEITEFLAPHNVPSYRAKQIYHWIYQRGVTTFEAMSNVPKDLRASLDQEFSLARPEVARHQKSNDGTQKWLLKMPDGQLVEIVYIPEETRGTLCISSQVGCTLTCKFCHTGTQKLVRNLGAAEMLHQIMFARDMLDEWPKDGQPDRTLTNVVLMGMGEPLYNYENIRDAMRIAMDPDGLAISKRRITLSTSGVVPQIIQCGEELGLKLAVSLHAPNDALRSEIMPINNKYPINDLLNACAGYPDISEHNRVTFEYVMLDGVNDSIENAKELTQILKRLPSKVNIIPFNPWPGAEYTCTPMPRIKEFAKILERAGIPAPIRKTRGEDILAACGQLKTDSERAPR